MTKYAWGGDEMSAIANLADAYFSNTIGEAIRNAAPHNVNAKLYRIDVVDVDPRASEREVCAKFVEEFYGTLPYKKGDGKGDGIDIGQSDFSTSSYIVPADRVYSLLKRIANEMRARGGEQGR